MGIGLRLDSCKGCKRATHTSGLKCVYCGYDYFEYVYGKPRPILENGETLEVHNNLEKLFGSK